MGKIVGTDPPHGPGLPARDQQDDRPRHGHRPPQIDHRAAEEDDGRDPQGVQRHRRQRHGASRPASIKPTDPKVESVVDSIKAAGRDDHARRAGQDRRRGTPPAAAPPPRRSDVAPVKAAVLAQGHAAPTAPVTVADLPTIEASTPATPEPVAKTPRKRVGKAQAGRQPRADRGHRARCRQARAQAAQEGRCRRPAAPDAARRRQAGARRPSPWPTSKRSPARPTRSDDELAGSEAPLIDHLIELRKRLIRSLIVLFVLLIGCFFIAGPIFNILVEPYQATLPQLFPSRRTSSG